MTMPITAIERGVSRSIWDMSKMLLKELAGDEGAVSSRLETQETAYPQRSRTSNLAIPCKFCGPQQPSTESTAIATLRSGLPGPVLQRPAFGHGMDFSAQRPCQFEIVSLARASYNRHTRAPEGSTSCRRP